MGCDHVRVGVAVILRDEGHILMGRRKGSHGAGTWAFPGGHLERNETVAQCAAREILEETGIEVNPLWFKKLTFTNDVFSSEDKHYVTLYVEASNILAERPIARIMEPEKCGEWRWFDAPPEPLFLPVANLLRDGFPLWG